MADSKIVIELTDEQAQAILDDLAALRGATAVEWQTQTPALTKLANTLVLMLYPGRAA